MERAVAPEFKQFLTRDQCMLLFEKSVHFQPHRFVKYPSSQDSFHDLRDVRAATMWRSGGVIHTPA